MAKLNPNLSPAANRRLGASFIGDVDTVPEAFRTFEGFSRFAPASVQRTFTRNPSLSPAKNRADEKQFNDRLLADKIRFVNPGLSPALQNELLGLHNTLTKLEGSSLDARRIARPLLDQIEKTPDVEGNLPRGINLDAPSTQRLGREGRLSPILPPIGGREGARTGFGVVAGTQLNRAGISAILNLTRPGPVLSRTGARVPEGRR